jgi:hypothetical protein
VDTALDRYLRNTRQLVSIGTEKGRSIADHKRLGMTGNRQVLLDNHAAGAIARHTKSRAHGEAADTGGPQHGPRIEPFVPEHTPFASTIVTRVFSRISMRSRCSDGAPHLAVGARSSPGWSDQPRPARCV